MRRAIVFAILLLCSSSCSDSSAPAASVAGTYSGSFVNETKWAGMFPVSGTIELTQLAGVVTGTAVITEPVEAAATYTLLGASGPLGVSISATNPQNPGSGEWVWRLKRVANSRDLSGKDTTYVGGVVVRAGDAALTFVPPSE